MSALVVVLLCLPIAVLASMVGIGGGVFVVPLWLAAGFSFVAASSASLVMTTALGASAAVVYLRKGLVEPALVFTIGPAAWLVSFASGFLSGHLDERLLRGAFACVLLGLSLLLFKQPQARGQAPAATGGRWSLRREREGEVYFIPLVGAAGAGALAGLLAGLFGIGGGVLIVPILTLAFRIPIHIAVASSSLLLALTSVFGASGHALAGHIDWLPALAAAATAVLGAQLGARLTSRLKPHHLRRLLALVLFAVALWIGIGVLRQG